MAQACSQTYMSICVINPFFSNNGMNSPGDRNPISGCTQRTRASAPASRSSARLNFGWKYTVNCPWRSPSSMESVMRCSRSSLLRSASSYTATWVLYRPRMLFAASSARSHICSTDTAASVTSYTPHFITVFLVRSSLASPAAAKRS